MPPKPDRDETLVKALVRAHRWRRKIESGQAKSITDLAEQEGVTVARVCRLLPLTCLAPEIVEASSTGSRRPQAGRDAWFGGRAGPRRVIATRNLLSIHATRRSSAGSYPEQTHGSRGCNDSSEILPPAGATMFTPPKRRGSETAAASPSSREMRSRPSASTRSKRSRYAASRGAGSGGLERGRRADCSKARASSVLRVIGWLGKPLEPQRVQHDQQARARHQYGGQDWLQVAGDGQHQTDGVVPERPRQIGQDRPADRPAQLRSPTAAAAARPAEGRYRPSRARGRWPSRPRCRHPPRREPGHRSGRRRPSPPAAPGPAIVREQPASLSGDRPASQPSTPTSAAMRSATSARSPVRSTVCKPMPRTAWTVARASGRSVSPRASTPRTCPDQPTWIRLSPAASRR